MRGNIALYWMNVFDEIVFDPTFGAFGANENFDKVRHRGIETSIAIDVLSWLELTGTYTLEDVTIRKHHEPTFVGERMPITPLHRGTLALWATLPYHFGVGWNTNIVGSRGLSNDFTNARQRLSTYATHDLHIEFAPPLGEHFDGALTFDLRNLTGERYADFGSVAFDFGAGALVDFFNPAVRRTWAVGFRLTLRR